jgi:hypothetical protein
VAGSGQRFEGGGERAERMLCDLIKRELDVRVSPAMVSFFIQQNWGRLSVLAHVIHDEAIADRRRNVTNGA